VKECRFWLDEPGEDSGSEKSLADQEGSSTILDEPANLQTREPWLQELLCTTPVSLNR